jgi:hypothetical protein
MLKSFPILRKNDAHLALRKHYAFWGLSVLNMQKYFLFVSSFEHINFGTNGKYSKKIYENPNYYAFIMIF